MTKKQTRNKSIKSQTKHQLSIINSIMEKALNPPPGIDVFVRYSGHVNVLDIDIHKDANYEKGGDHNIIYSKRVYLNYESATEKLNEILSEIEIVLSEKGEK